MSSSQQQPPPQQPPVSQRPSLRLNLSAAAATAAGKQQQQNQQQQPIVVMPPSKKQKVYAPVALPPLTASVAQVTVLHQVTRLHLVLLNNTWYMQGTSTLYLANNNSSSSSDDLSQQLALHLRSSCQVQSLSIETPVLTKMVSLSSEYKHADPLHHVLLRPPSTFVISEDADSTSNATNKAKLDADAQSSRGAAGMTTALRAASMASNMGELRVSYQAPPTPPGSSTTAANSSTANTTTATSASNNNNSSNNAASQRLVEVVWKRDLLSHPCLERHQERRKKRVDYCAQQLALAGTNGLKVTVTYSIPLLTNPSTTSCTNVSLGGLHVRTSTTSMNTVSSNTNQNNNPHVYTTCGVFGDHEGPRCWFPCVDSAATVHRATHQLSVTLTAQMTRGLSVVATGDDAGHGDSYLHLPLNNNSTSADEIAAARKVLGSDHVDFVLMAQVLAQQQQAPSPHVIPNDIGGTVVPTLDMIQTTVVYQSACWSPIPARSMGFAAGPFRVLEDAEYFGCDEEEDSERFQLLQQAREDGHGIQQYYFCPIFERKFLHLHADQTLLAVNVVPLPLNFRQVELREQLKALVHVSTVGVPHRALNLMRDVLALPTFRTWSHTQVWIPDCHQGGITSGALHTCPEVSVNGFLGMSILDSRLLPPSGSRLPYYQGGRVLQFLQARAAIRGWLIAALPLGGNDDVANGYIHSVTESFLMSLYERGHGAHGEGGAKGGVFFSKRYSVTSGLNSANLDFLPVHNIEEMDTVIGGVGAVPIEERHNEQLWRSASNGSESHTSAIDEFNIRQLLCRDAVEALERVSEKDKNVPLPSLGWFGSHLSLTLLSSNATSSSDLGCGAVELLHPVGGLVYRALKSEIFRSIVEGRAGVANFIRLIRAALLAAHLGDIGEAELRLPTRREKQKSMDSGTTKAPTDSHDVQPPNPPFVVCVNEILKKKGLTHTLFTRALQNLSGPLKEAHLLGTLVDVEPNEMDPRTRRHLVDPEGFPNSYVRGSSFLYCRVGVQVEFGDGGLSQSGVAKGIAMQAYAEPIIPEGGIAYGGPITMRVVENEGQFREYVKDLLADGSRRDWGATFLHAKPVSTIKAQTAASGTIEGSKDAPKAPGQKVGPSYPSLQSKCASPPFNDTNFHRAGYQAIELIRLANLTPLLWVRVDPLGLYGGRISVFQPDACLAECLFHDGDAGAQVEAIRALAERPLRIQASTKVTAIYDVNVSELPVRVLADCLRGSPALHSSLPHTPAVRCQAALAIAQWQNNKAPPTKDSVGLDSWVGANLLIQYFRERFYSNGVVMPVKFTRLCLRKSEAEVAATAAAASESGAANPKHDENFEYLDSLEEGEERAEKAAAAASIEMEEDEEYRVRTAVVNAISSIRAKDGQTPPFVLQFLETVLEAQDAEMVSHLVYPDEELLLEKSFQQMKARASGFDDDSDEESEGDDELTPSLSFVSGKLVADALLALCNINAWPTTIMDPTTGKPMQSTGRHPVARLMKIARSWLDWELYREEIRGELAAETESGLSGNCHNPTAAAAILALANMSIMKQSTSDPPEEPTRDDATSEVGTQSSIDEVATVQFYVSHFDREPLRNDITRAACAQAVACICCAADRFQKDTGKSVGLLTALEFLLDRIVDERTSSGLRQTLALIMMDACTGKVCSSQRVGAIAGQNDLIASTARFLTGPLGSSHGGDNGSALLTVVSGTTFPAANAVNEGARRGRRLVGRAGHPKEAVDRVTIVRVARFATRLWRTINGDPPEPPKDYRGEPITGICAFDGALRCSLLALWQLIWPRGCFSVLQVQDWKSQEKTKEYAELGAHLVMQISEEEKAAAASEETSLSDINRFVEMELNRQAWRGEMAKKAYEMYKATKGSTAIQDVAAAEQGIGQPLPPIQRDSAFKQGGWIASAAQQRRALALDGGTAVTKLRLTVKTNPSDV